MLHSLFAVLLLVSLFGTYNLSAQDNNTGNIADRYTKREVMIPMRDGVRLYTAVYEPKNVVSQRPVIMVRTPYSVSPYNGGFSKDLGKLLLSEYVAHDYIVVIQNVRGTYMSEGEYENIRPVESLQGSSCSSSKSGDNAGTCGCGSKETSVVDDATDTYDTVEWLLHNTLNNGNVGVKGVSYPGFYATVAGLSGHPAIKAISPQAPVTDWFIGDDVYRNGSMMASIYSFGASFFRPRHKPTKKYQLPIVDIDKDLHTYFMERPVLSTIWKDFEDSLKFFNEIRNHPVYDGFWEARNPMRHAARVNVPALVVGGWFDGEDCYGAFETYRQLRSASSSEVFLAAGPWYHGAWKNKGFDHLGDAYFGTGSSESFIKDIEYKFFAHYLEGAPEMIAPVTFMPSEETMQAVMADKVHDVSSWLTSACWPSESMQYVPYYLAGQNCLGGDMSVIDGRGTASVDSATDDASKRSDETRFSYVSDPWHPVPSFAEAADSWDRAAFVQDQTYLMERNDLLWFESEQLGTPLMIEGRVKVSLNVAVDTDDADIFVKLVDVRPDGKKILIRYEVMPLRYRHSLSHPEPMIPGESERVEFLMNDIAHVFMPGHRIMVIVQSSNFPMHVLNPQKFFANQFDAVPQDITPCTVHVLSSPSSPSFVELPVVGR